jgi:hypothetical protein
MMPKYLENHYSVFAKALMLGEDVKDIKQKKQTIELLDGTKTSSYLMANDLMRDIQLWGYYTYAIQTGERVRLALNENAYLKVWMDIGLPQAEFVTPEEFTSKLKLSPQEKAKSRREDNTIYINSTLNKSQGGVFLEKLYGIRDEQGELTDLAKKVLKSVDNDYKKMVEFIRSQHNKAI